MRAECLTVLLLALLSNTLASDEQQVKKVNATNWLFKMSPNDHFCQDNCLLWPVKMRCEDAIAWYGYITRGVQKLTSPDSFLAHSLCLWNIETQNHFWLFSSFLRRPHGWQRYFQLENWKGTENLEQLTKTSGESVASVREKGDYFFRWRKSRYILSLMNKRDTTGKGLINFSLTLCFLFWSNSNHLQDF